MATIKWSWILRAKRMALCLTQRMVGDAMGYSNVYITYLETGQNTRSDAISEYNSWLDNRKEEEGANSIMGQRRYDDVFNIMVLTFLYQIVESSTEISDSERKVLLSRLYHSMFSSQHVWHINSV